MQLISIRNRFKYPKMTRLDTEQGRKYVLTVDEESQNLPSVTTILDAVKDKAFLLEWEARVGKEEADRIRNDAATVGTHMHSVIERLLLNRPLDPPRTWLQVKGYRMAIS